MGRWLAMAGVVVTVFLGTAQAQNAGTETAIFAGGCFWCVESDFDHVPGVLETVSGYIGGAGDNPTYKSYVKSGHLGAVKITYDPSVISYGQMLDVFWRSVDPTDAGGQFCDRGHSYTTAVFALNGKQKQIAKRSKAAVQKAIKPQVVTPVRDAGTFWPAEEYHQNYHVKRPLRYRFYRSQCGRDRRVKQVWGKAAYRGIPKS